MEFVDIHLLDSLWVGLIVGLASFVQSLTGFGFALVAVSLLPFFMELQPAVTLVLLVSLVSNVTLWWHYRSNFEWSRIIHLASAGLLTIPIGVLGLQHVPEHMALQLLGVLVLAYVVYSSLQLSPPDLQRRRWAYAFGAAAGVLTGAFNTGGPPLVIYGSCKEWSPEQFRSHLPGVFSIMSVFAIAAHLSQGHFDRALFTQVGYVIPFFGVGLGLGLWISRYVNATQFRQVVLMLLGVIGLKLVL